MKKLICILTTISICICLSACGNYSSYDEGRGDGYSEGYESGYNKGFYDGHEEGYSEGYSVATSEYEESGGHDQENWDGAYDLYSAINDEVGDLGYYIGYDEGYNLMPYHHFSDKEELKGIFADYVDGYGDGYEEKVSELTKDKEFDYKSIPLIEVESSFIDSVGYSFDHDILLIHMNGKDLYQYENVDQFDFRSIMDASSPGEYFNENIKDKYKYKKVY